MNRGDKRPHRRRIVHLGPESLSDSKSVGVSNFGRKRAVTISRSTIIRASAERCFDLINKQLEVTPSWDPTIILSNPISIKHVRVGSMSRVIFNLGGVSEEAVAMIRSFRPNRYIFWTSTHSSQLQEEWQLQPEPHGTVVTVTLGYNPGRWIFGRLIDKLIKRTKIENTVVEMLGRLKATAEGP